MTLITPRRTEPPLDLKSKRTYYASLWGTGSAKARSRETWLVARFRSMQLAVATTGVLALYLGVSSLVG